MNLFAKLGREYRLFQDILLVKKWTGDISPDSDHLVADDYEQAVDKFSANVAFRFEGKSTTYSEFDETASRFANWALAQGLKAGDCIALFMENRPEYVAAWAGFAKIGVVTALINHNLENDALAHCVNISEAKLIVTGADQDAAITGAAGLFKDAPKVWSLGGAVGEDLGGALAGASSARPDRSHRAGLLGKDLCLYVYTSGTTGLPKAARLTQARTQGMMKSFIAPCRITPKDRVYITLPLYHGTGGLCGVGQALMTGATIILRRKFSASAFWDDATDEGATAIVYIGELCRYLVNSPPHPKERAHHIRTGFGNGLRPEVWEEFLERFNIPHLAEFYGSTEGNVSFINFDGKPGAIGRIPGWLKSQFAHVGFVKFDIETEQPVRGPDGFCIPAADDEPGEAIGKIGDDVRQRFEGYNDQKATEKKLLRDVFEKGDLWFRTGDLLKKDKAGYIYFVDRIGDTYRWKGENVSTNEVGEALSKIDGIATANVYGVPVPGTDGKAGMAAVTLDGAVDMPGVYKRLAALLPSYSVPIFIRVQPEAETTGTFKYRKVELVAEGFDPSKVEGDAVWMYDPAEGGYAPVTPARYEKLLAGGFKF
ncbi:very-long-chain acyl-CoA synthetase [Hyphomonas neptunium ATCC 15444]|uniref:Very-long-chain acyl-CoA synthetase n=2 Tax=Hyphomonas TaxID=85 RepID=Q0BZ31_HYPNA|nr:MULTISPECIES: long-chain-acyl-CoA synthetase [Hyphomonas]ABI76300.1 very-long-chain acyl-CoA synthetase [Hyphomonas neptunium ATCC 15444]KCZ95354.1 long-chain-acyl-CoA synthetase [Hyphomonas hirschiana VP5]